MGMRKAFPHMLACDLNEHLHEKFPDNRPDLVTAGVMCLATQKIYTVAHTRRTFVAALIASYKEIIWH